MLQSNARFFASFNSVLYTSIKQHLYNIVKILFFVNYQIYKGETMKKYGTVGVSHPLKEALRKLSFETEAYSMNTLIHAMYILAQQHKEELKEIVV